MVDLLISSRYNVKNILAVSDGAVVDLLISSRYNIITMNQTKQRAVVDLLISSRYNMVALHATERKAVVDLLISSRYNMMPANLYFIWVCWLFSSEKKQLLLTLALFLDSFSEEN